jgi:hypothetical protein
MRRVREPSGAAARLSPSCFASTFRGEADAIAWSMAVPMGGPSLPHWYLDLRFELVGVFRDRWRSGW